jgi:dTDP-4-amino-4,6-dideoxygalactose transaminase
VIRCSRCDELRAHLEDYGVPTDIYYSIPLPTAGVHLFGLQGWGFTRIGKREQEVLALPVFPELLIEQQEMIVESIMESTREAIAPSTQDSLQRRLAEPGYQSDQIH